MSLLSEALLGSSLVIIHLTRMRRLRFRSCSSIFHNVWLASSFLSLPSRKASSRQRRKKIGWAILKCFVAGRVGVRWARHRTPMRAGPATPVRQPHVRNGTHELSVTRWRRILTAHNSRRPLVGELPLRPDQARRREGHVAAARGPSTDPVRSGLARAACDQLWGVPFARVNGVPLRQGAEYD